jgi:hypothetical protein
VTFGLVGPSVLLAPIRRFDDTSAAEDLKTTIRPGFDERGCGVAPARARTRRMRWWQRW